MATLAIAGSLCGCTGAESHTAATEARDSAGITIVENRALEDEPVAGWRLASEPAVSIGVLEGDPHYQLFRVVGAARLSDGRIVVANSGTHELRFYGPDGGYVHAVGREGEGPGEFKQLGTVWRYAGDSLLTYDWSTRRASIFDSEGGFARSFMLESPEERRFPRSLGSIGSGILVTFGSIIGPNEVRDGLIEDSTTAIRFAPDGTIAAKLGRFPGQQSYLKSMSGGGFSVMSFPFGLAPRFALAEDGFCFGRGESYEIRCYDDEGNLTRILRVDRPNLPVTPEDIERDRQRHLDNASSESWRERLLEMLPEIPYPDRMPAYRLMLFDAAGRLWVERYPRPGDETASWSVFDETGVRVAELELPISFAPQQIDGNDILGVYSDELGIERVQLYRLIRS